MINFTNELCVGLRQGGENKTAQQKRKALPFLPPMGHLWPQYRTTQMVVLNVTIFKFIK
jgi:hypothetical protein